MAFIADRQVGHGDGFVSYLSGHPAIFCTFSNCFFESFYCLICTCDIECTKLFYHFFLFFRGDCAIIKKQKNFCFLPDCDSCNFSFHNYAAKSL